MENWRKNIAYFLVGQGLSLFGSMVVYYAILWHITLSTGSGVMMMWFIIAGTLPLLFTSPFGGVLADRFNKKHLINIADGTIAIVTLFLAIGFFLGEPTMYLLFLCIAVRSLGQGIQSPAINALIPEIVPKEKLTRINGINGSLQYSVMLFSPVLGAVLLTFMSLPAILLIDVVTATLGIILLYFFVKVNHEKKVTKVTYFEELKRGVKYIHNSKFLRAFLLIMIIFMFMITPVASLTPLHISREFGELAWKLSVSESLFFAGSILGGIIISIWGGFKQKSYTMALATVLTGIIIAVLGIIHNFWIFVIIAGISGITAALFNPIMMSVMQINVDKEYMGRVFSMITMVSSVVMPISIMVWGPLADIYSTSLLFIISGVVIFFLSLFFIFNKPILEAGAK